jgi:hypothetical protein
MWEKKLCMNKDDDEEEFALKELKTKTGRKF